MNVLDSPIEALPFNYLNLASLTNLCTCLALLTAAITFWKIHSAGFPKPPPHHPIQTSPDVAVTPLTGPAVRDAVPSAVTVGRADDDVVDGVRKVKFAAYYKEEEDDDKEEQCSRGGGEREGWSLTAALEEREGSQAEWWERWERLLRLRNGLSENGWYTWQDLTELNGNVVKLWDGGLRCRGNE